MYQTLPYPNLLLPYFSSTPSLNLSYQLIRSIYPQSALSNISIHPLTCNNQPVHPLIMQVVRNVVFDPRMLPGGGATELAIAHAIAR